jgi:hypothetical protein
MRHYVGMSLLPGENWADEVNVREGVYMRHREMSI